MGEESATMARCKLVDSWNFGDSAAPCNVWLDNVWARLANGVFEFRISCQAFRAGNVDVYGLRKAAQSNVIICGNRLFNPGQIKFIKLLRLFLCIGRIFSSIDQIHRQLDVRPNAVSHMSHDSVVMLWVNSDISSAQL